MSNPFRKASEFKPAVTFKPASNAKRGGATPRNASAKEPNRRTVQAKRKGGENGQKNTLLSFLGGLRRSAGAGEKSEKVSKAAAKGQPGQERFELKTRVVGCQFHSGAADLCLGKSSHCLLKREPENRYDSNAILVIYVDTNQPLGHVPAAEAGFLHEFLDDSSCRTDRRGKFSVTARIPTETMLEDDYEQSHFPLVITVCLPRSVHRRFGGATAALVASMEKAQKREMKQRKELRERLRRKTGPKQQSLSALFQRKQPARSSGTDATLPTRLRLDHFPVEVLKHLFVCGNRISIRDFLALRLCCKQFKAVLDDRKYLFHFVVFHRAVKQRFVDRSLYCWKNWIPGHDPMYMEWLYFVPNQEEGPGCIMLYLDRTFATKVSFEATDVLEAFEEVFNNFSLPNTDPQGPAMLAVCLLHTEAGMLHTYVRALATSQHLPNNTKFNKIVDGFQERFIAVDFLYALMFLLNLHVEDNTCTGDYNIVWKQGREEQVEGFRSQMRYMQDVVLLKREVFSHAVLQSAECAVHGIEAVGQDSNLMTDEQLAIMNAKVSSKNELVTVEAFAGTGKTTTLLAFARANPSKRLLYLVFNVSIRDHAKTQFPPNTDVKSVHSMAYAKVGFRFAHKLKPDLKVSHIASHKDEIVKLLKENEGTPGYGSYGGRWKSLFTPEFCNTLCMTINKYCSSDASVSWMDCYAGEAGLANENLNRLAILASKIVFQELMCNKTHTFPMTHNGYLKLYALSRPRLDRTYDIVLVDEAQDISPVVQGIVLAQKCGKIIVGDSHQSIYSFTGAKNTLKQLRDSRKASKHYVLTQSFRFGWRIAALANFLLHKYKRDGIGAGACGLRRVVGTTTKSAISLCAAERFYEWPGAERSHPVTQRTMPYCIVARTNQTLWHVAMTFLNDRTPFVFVSGAKGYNFSRAINVAKFLGGENVDGKFFKLFKRPTDLLDFAQKTSDGELLRCFEIVRQFGSEVIVRSFQNIIAESESHERENLSSGLPNVVRLGTVHKVKGLEFPAVLIAPDFIDLEERPVDMEEVNMLYVAITRAQFRLRVPDQLFYSLARSGFSDVVAVEYGSRDPAVTFEHINAMDMLEGE